MSLKVWLPLDGDLHNQGVLNPSISATTPSYTVGKIGQCYKGTDLTITTNNNFGKIWSLCFWGYVIGNSITSDWTLIACLNDNNSNLRIEVCPSSYSNGKYCYSTHNNPGNAIINSSIASPSGGYYDKWAHFCLTSDGTTITKYMNGIKIGTSNYTGSGYINGTFFFTNNDKIYKNDIRIYDHCLSAAEVKEITQGLVVHYKLDASSEELITTIPSTNVYSYPTFNTNSAAGGWSHWGSSGHSGSYGQNTDKKYIYNKNNTYSHWITEDAGTGKYNLLYQSPAFDGGYRSLQAIIKEENSLPITESICYPNWNARNGGVPTNKWTSIKSLGDGFYYCCCEGVSQDGSNDLIGIIVQPGYKIYVSECYLENNTETCTPIFKYSSNIIQDSSGYEYNGTITGTIIAQSESPRYNSSIYLNGSSYISTAAGTMSWYQMDQGTLACWMKPTDSMIGWRGSWGICQDSAYGQKGWAITDYGNTFRITYTNGSTYKTETSGKTLPQNEWHHCAATLDGTTVKMYFDGELVETVTIDWGTATMPTVTRMELGVDLPGTHEMFTGNYSDARFYVTPLSDDDIKSLYNTSMKIDNSQNIHTFELIENQDKISITKTGQLTCDEINEDTAAKLYKSGIIETAELIER